MSWCVCGARAGGYFAASYLMLAFLGVAPARAQVLVAEGDLYEVRFAETLVVEAFGVLDNDVLDDESAGENGASAELVTDVAHGTLSLAADGSFSYAPGASFEGTDSFVYRAVFEAASDEATVTLTACEGGPQIFTCWKEAAFLAKAVELGHPSLTEGFEDDATWGIARTPSTVRHVTSQGIDWRANDFDSTHVGPTLPPPPPPHHITTGSGPARSGLYGVFDLAHGYATGTPAQCDIDSPPAHCLYHDGVTIRPAPGQTSLYGAGGYFTGTYGANIAIVVDGDWMNPIGGGTIAGGAHKFFGVIDAGPLGFNEIQFRETDGKVGQALYIFADDFTILSPGPIAAVPSLGLPGMVALTTSLLVAALTCRTWRRRRPSPHTDRVNSA